MDEGEIIALFREGERDRAFNTLVRTYSERLYWHLRGMVQTHEDADDLLQNTWVRVWNALDTFREDSSLYTWLYRIATNEAISFLRKQRVRSFVTFSDRSESIAGRISTEGLFDGDKLQMALQKAIAKLPPKQKAVFTMRYFEDMKYEEIAEILDTSVASLKTSYHFASEKVKALIKKEF